MATNRSDFAVTRRDVMFGLGMGLSAARCSSARQQNKRPRNVLIIMSDQHKRDCLGVAGDQVARKPNLDAFSRTAVRFTSAYCTNPVCTPSRASILTGLYTHNHQAWNNTVPWQLDIKR